MLAEHWLDSYRRSQPIRKTFEKRKASHNPCMKRCVSKKQTGCLYNTSR